MQRTEDILRRVEALPGVQAAFASNLVPLSGGGGFSQIVIEGRPSEKGKEPGIGFIGVSPHMLKTLGLSVIRGRELTDTEAMTRAPYAVVNQAMVEAVLAERGSARPPLPHAQRGGRRLVHDSRMSGTTRQS